VRRRRLNLDPPIEMLHPPIPPAFVSGFIAGRPQIVTRQRVDDLDTPVGAFLKLGGATKAGSFLFESVEGGETRGRYSFVCMNPDLVWKLDDGKASISAHGSFDPAAFVSDPRPALDSLRATLAEAKADGDEALPPMATALFGYLGYETVRLVEVLPDTLPDPLGVPGGLMVRPQLVVAFDGVRQEAMLITVARPALGVNAQGAWEAAQARLDAAQLALDAPLHAPANGTPFPMAAEPKANFEPAAFRAVVEKVKDYVRAGDAFQVVPSQRFSAPFPHPPIALYRALRRINPSPFLFFLQFHDFAIVGSSPEILVRVRDGTVTIRPIAGTRPRGATPAQDRALEEELLADPKERSEHLMLLDLGRNDVGRVSLARAGGNAAASTGGLGRGGVRVTASFTVERYSHVMHIVSNVEGQLDPKHDALDALLAGFPAGTVSGAPKVRAMEIINEVEPHARGVYAGAVGYIAPNGELDMCIALRTGVVKDGVLSVQAGGGVVLDSDPELERQETVHKAKALFRAAEEAGRFV